VALRNLSEIILGLISKKIDMILGDFDKYVESIENLDKTLDKIAPMKIISMTSRQGRLTKVNLP
jgi:hypothetical protein